VLGGHSGIDLYVYDRADQEAFLGHVKVSPNVSDDGSKLEGWYKLEARDPETDHVSGEIHLECSYQKTDKKQYGPEDFQILKLIGKGSCLRLLSRCCLADSHITGTFGQVYLVRKKDTQRVYAMKVLSKKVIVQKKEIAHTLGERNILVRTAMADSPFIVGLKFSFQTATDLYLVTGYMSGGELFWHLQKAGRFDEERAKFYIAELILALQHLHSYDIVYRDLKPENILLDANGHIALCDFGLSKANLTKDDTTNTFCGTTEYLAPEVLLDEQGYTTMVDFWSLGVLVFEMCCGWSPFYADDTQQMYKNIAFGKVRFPRDALSTEGRNFVKGLLNRNPKHRLGAINDAEDLKAHPFFADMDWDALMNKMVVPPFKPKLKSVLDTSNFDPEFTNALQNSSSLNARAAALTSGHMPASTPLSPGVQANFKGFTFVDESTIEEQFRGNDLDKMEEDDEEDWEQPSDPKESRENRMSGIIKTSDGEEGIFNNSHFDIWYPKRTLIMIHLFMRRAYSVMLAHNYLPAITVDGCFGFESAWSCLSVRRGAGAYVKGSWYTWFSVFLRHSITYERSVARAMVFKAPGDHGFYALCLLLQGGNLLLSSGRVGDPRLFAWTGAKSSHSGSLCSASRKQLAMQVYILRVSHKALRDMFNHHCSESLGQIRCKLCIMSFLWAFSRHGSPDVQGLQPELLLII